MAYKFVPRTARRQPMPTKRTLVVDKAQAGLPESELSYFWVFGPKTKHKWPSGDFLERFEGNSTVIESAWILEHLLQQCDVCLYDPDMCVDDGL